jgi:hypothetical protein
MTDTADTIALIRRHHRRRRFAMKIQQKLDRALESFIRINATDWHPDLDEKERAKINREVQALIKRIREGEESEFSDFVKTSDAARKPADEMRHISEREMEKLAKDLPVHPWIESVHGAGALGLATIVAEAGDLANYSNVAKLISRLGFAPYDGLAGSTWKRETWRPRALTKEEWIAHPFSGQRYALMIQIAEWLVNAQWIGKKKTGTGEGAPDGSFGQVYADRRARTKTTHPDWTDGHARADGLRITMKEFLKQLWLQWNGVDLENKERRARRWKQVAQVQRKIDARQREAAQPAAE